LNIKKGENSLCYKLDESYQLSDNEPVQFSAPTDVSYTFGGQGLNYASFDWNPDAGSGWFGAGIEIKKAGSEDFALLKIDHAYENTFVAQFSSTDFSQGINIIRIYYIGGPSLDRSAKQVYLIHNSEYKIFNLIVSIDGGIYFECYDGYQSSPNTRSCSATAYNITITFSQSEWDQYAHQL
jgi:hypothetical protein